MNIRRLGQQDLAALLDLYKHLHPNEIGAPTKPVAAVWNEIQNSAAISCYGGFVEDVLAATCTLVVVPNLTRGCRSYGLIENVVTHQGYRRKGHGAAIVGHALAHAWGVGCYKVMLLTGRKEEGIAEFYQSVGFNGTEKKGFVARPKL